MIGCIIGKKDETKGYKVLLASDRKVITTRHISAIETLGAAANEQVRQALETESDAEIISNENSHDPVLTCDHLTREGGEISNGNRGRSRNARIDTKSANGSSIRRSMRSKKKSRRQLEADEYIYIISRKFGP